MQLTNLKDILAAATVANSNELVEKEITWKQGEPEVEYTATIGIVANISFAASERITIGSAKTRDTERLARNIVERVRFGGEKMSFEDAANLHPALGWALVTAVYEFDESRKPKEEVKEEAKV